MEIQPDASVATLVEWATRAESCAPDDFRCLGELAVELAAHLQRRAQQLQTPAERRQQAELDRMVRNPRDKATLIQLTDQAFRSSRAARAADQLIHILDVQGIPRFFSPIERTMLRGFQSFGGYLPGVAVPLVKEKMRHETANVILPAEPETLARHLQQRRREGVRMNLNLLGEAILGEGEAQRRLEAYLAALQMPEIECVSIKISTLYSQISPLAREETIRTLSHRLELLYRAAQRNRFRRHDGTEVPKFVYLDMEEYRDMWLTAEVFMRTLDREGMEHVQAGIALQAYIPDSFRVQRTLTQWAIERVAAGKSPITIRLVKGANMEMERVEASLRGWPQAPFKRKLDTDANYKKMLDHGLREDHVRAVRLGVASHNLFEVAFALLLAARRGLLEYIQLEMLEGMANAQRRALREMVSSLLLYAPACRKEDFVSAIGYLVRRMDENTGPDNYLRHAFRMEVGSEDWERLRDLFLQSIEHMPHVSDAPRRTQNRQVPPLPPSIPTDWRAFQNEPDTDFSLIANCHWARELTERWQARCGDLAPDVLASVAHADIRGNGRLVESMDPSRPGVVVARYQELDRQQLEQAVECALEDVAGWRQWSARSRFECLRNVAQNIRIRRGDLIGAAMADGGKTIGEADPEVSEAVDFVEFYARTALEIHERPELAVHPRGTIVVISPWNFPIAIPGGGIAAALAAGNTVVLKPASDTVLPARLLCECFWEGGGPQRGIAIGPLHGRSCRAVFGK
ncbi:MAG: hypothetical protein KatS3mg111_2871 [Pirellulaceae bacterium]|nr:MAG: hypothetical protein KatS3mg111_2871 [Pirellulaceae bacterium]